MDFPSGKICGEEKAKQIEKAGIEKIRIRSVLTCEAKRGVCVKCYGRNLATGRLVELGEAIGIVMPKSPSGEKSLSDNMKKIINWKQASIIGVMLISIFSKSPPPFSVFMAVPTSRGGQIVQNRPPTVT